MNRLYRLLALTVLGALLPPAAQAAKGTGTLSHNFGCQGTTLTYTVTGGPPSTCGDLFTVRNGTLITGANWLCTNASGNASKGPWTWTGTPADQYDNDLRIVWPDGSETTRGWHVWDKTPPTATITSTGAPPTSFSGTAVDTTYGSGFRSNCGDSPWTSTSYVYAIYTDNTTGKTWTPTTGIYTSTSGANIIYGTITGMPSQSVNWSVSTPTLAAHVPGHNYTWRVCVSDCCSSDCDSYTFTVP